jgi:hypothetical protein
MSEDYRFNLVADAVLGNDDEPTLITERIDQIRERSRIGTDREAMADRDFLLAEVDRLAPALVAAQVKVERVSIEALVYEVVGETEVAHNFRRAINVDMYGRSADA